MSKLAVVIPCRNQGATLARAIESALPQCDHVIIVDDSSDDGTYKLIEHYWTKYPAQVKFLRFFRQRGVVASRNAAIAEVKVDYILPLDADDVLLPDAAKTLLKHASLETFVYGSWVEHPIGVVKTPSPIGMINRKNIAHATFLFSKVAWEKVGGYDPDFEIGCEDWSFMLALLRAGYRAVQVDEPIYERTVSGSGRSSACQRNKAAIESLLNEKFGLTLPHA